MQKRQIIIFLVAIFIVGGAVALAGWLSGQKEAPEVSAPPAAKKYVSVQSVRYTPIQTEVEAYGRVVTAHALDLLSEVSGRMFAGKVPLKEGATFKKGDLLFYIDDTEPLLSLKAQRSGFLKDIAGILPDISLDFPDRHADWQAFFSSLDANVSLPALPEAKSPKEKTFLATRNIFTTYYTIKSTEARLEKYRYYAPFEGSIVEVMMQSGAFINPGSRIGRIIKSGQHELKVSVETRDIPWIQTGADAQIYSEETNQVWKGYVSRISDFVNQNTQSVDVYLAIESSKNALFDGQFLAASIPAATIQQGMIIPRNALYDGSEVFVLQDSLLKRKNVFIHRLTANEAIFSGLSEGEELVVEPLINAHNNMKAFKRNEGDLANPLATSTTANLKGTSNN